MSIFTFTDLIYSILLMYLHKSFIENIDLVSYNKQTSILELVAHFILWIEKNEATLIQITCNLWRQKENHVENGSNNGFEMRGSLGKAQTCPKAKILRYTLFLKLHSFKSKTHFSITPVKFLKIVF